MSEQKVTVGEINVKAGGQTEPEYKFSVAPESRFVVTEMFAEWSPSVSDQDIKAFLQSKGPSLGLPPEPNYDIAYGPKGTGSICPLMQLFDLKIPRARWTIAAFDPVPDPIPVADTPIEIVVRGTPIVVKNDFGLRFSIQTRPFNT